MRHNALPVLFGMFITYFFNTERKEKAMRRRRKGMRLNAPTKRIWWLSIILVAVALAGQFTRIPYVSEYSFWIIVASYILLLLSTFVKGL
ncbi:MAG: hypothetical protein D3924_10315 [Candidatus Electrothrix sp. AR4]|nr:hypothetical protein [Candidatus Electrothrix sp. AR4]